MADHNIYIKNQLGTSKGATKKLSAKGSIERKTITMTQKFKPPKSISAPGNIISNIDKGGSTGILSKGAKKIGTAGAVIGVLLTTGEKVASFAINMRESKTGNSLRAHNSRTTLNTVTSVGLNYAYGALNNELFRKKEISRQNNALDYGRDLYQINVEGSKTKRI